MPARDRVEFVDQHLWAGCFEHGVEAGIREPVAVGPIKFGRSRQSHLFAPNSGPGGPSDLLTSS